MTRETAGDATSSSPDPASIAVVPAADLGPAALAACLDALPHFAMLVDADHRIHFANRALTTALGSSREQLLGTRCQCAVHGLVAPLAGCPLEVSLVEGGPCEREVFDERSGVWLAASIYPTPLRTSAGQAIFLHTAQDITARKQAQVASARAQEVQAILAELLRLALTDVPIAGLLSAVLDRMLSIPWLSVDARGAMFLVEGQPPVLALMALHDRPVDVLLTDMVMPGMSGTQLAARVHALHPEVAVVFMSGHVDDVLAREGLAADATFVRKPFRWGEITDAVRHVLPRREPLR